MMKRKLFKVLLLVCFVSVLGGCGSSEVDSESKAGEANKAVTVSSLLSDSTYFVGVENIDKNEKIATFFEVKDGKITSFTPFEKSDLTLGELSKMDDKDIKDVFNDQMKVVFDENYERNVQVWSDFEKEVDKIKLYNDTLESEFMNPIPVDLDAIDVSKNKFNDYLDFIKSVGEYRSYDYALDLVTDSSGNRVDHEVLKFSRDIFDLSAPGSVSGDDEKVSFKEKEDMEFNIFASASSLIYDSYFSGFRTDTDFYILTKTDKEIFVDFDSVDSDADNITVDGE